MFDPLRLMRERNLVIQLNISDDNYEMFRCIGFGSIYNHTSPPIARYRLQSLLDASVIELEVFKDQQQNFHIQAYLYMEEKSFSIEFLSILGTDSIGFMRHTKDDEPVHTIYHRILQADEPLDHYKYICDPQELPDDPRALGYTRDGNGNWYMMITRSQGRIKQFYSGEKRRCWEYLKEDSGESLLIEMVEAKEPKQRRFLIYQGIHLSRDQIHIHTPKTVKSPATQQKHYEGELLFGSR